MKRTGILFLFLLVLIFCLSAAEREGTAAGDAPKEAEWTVMFYMCGSNLESKYSYATGNLEEIAVFNRRQRRAEFQGVQDLPARHFEDAQIAVVRPCFKQRAVGNVSGFNVLPYAA